MKERAAFVIALFPLFVGLQGQPRNQNALQNRERLEDSILKSGEILKNIYSALQNSEGKSSSSYSSKQETTLLRTATKKRLVFTRYNNIKKYLSEENYILQDIILRMKKYKIKDYPWLALYIRKRNDIMKGLSIRYLEILSGEELEQYILQKFYNVFVYLNENKGHLEEVIQTDAAELEIHHKKEMQLLENVQSFLEKNNKSPSGEPNNKDVISMVYVTWLIFWMSLHFRVYSIYSSNFTHNFENKAICDSYFEAMMWAFDSFKSEINGFNKKKSSCFSLNCTSDERDIQFVINELLKLSLDFVLTEDALEKKNPDLYESGIIKYNLIVASKVGDKMYKTIFPSDAAITEFFRTENFHDVDVINIQNVYQIFNQKLSEVIDGMKLKKIEHFFMKKVFGTKKNSSEKKNSTDANEVTWLNPLLFEPSIWAALEGQNLNFEIHTPGQQQIIELIKFLKQTDQDTLTKFITTWRSWKIIP